MTKRNALLVAWLVGCGGGNEGRPEGDASSDDTAPDGGGELDGAVAPECPDSSGNAALAEALAAGEVRAGRIDRPDALLGGISADGRVGDFKLYNSEVAFVVQSERIG